MAPRLPVDREKAAEICRSHRIRRLALFGSVLRDDFGPQSDVDVLVEFEPGHVPGFFGLHRIECEIAATFGCRRVDLMKFRSLNPHLRERILAEALDEVLAQPCCGPLMELRDAGAAHAIARRRGLREGCSSEVLG